MTLINNKEYIDEISWKANSIFFELKDMFGSNYAIDINNYEKQIIASLKTLNSSKNIQDRFQNLNNLRDKIKPLINSINKTQYQKSILGSDNNNNKEQQHYNSLKNKAVNFFSTLSKNINHDLNDIRDDYTLELERRISNITNDKNKLDYEFKSIKEIIPNIKEKQNIIESIFKESDDLIGSFESRAIEYTKENQQNLNTHYLTLRQELSDKTDELLSNISSDVKRHLLSTENEIKALKQKSEEDHLAFKSIYENMVGLYVEAGNERLAKHNLEQAQIEKESADKMRSMGIGLLFVLIGFAAWFFVLLAQLPAEVNYLSWFIPRFLTLTFCSTPVIYLLKESASHRHKENLYRQRGTQLATIDAYLADFDDTNKVGVKSDLAKNFYTVHNGKTDTSNVPDFIKQMKEFAAVTKTFNKIAPAEQPQPQQAQSTPVTPIHEAINTEKKQQA